MSVQHAIQEDRIAQSVSGKDARSLHQLVHEHHRESHFETQKEKDCI